MKSLSVGKIGYTLEEFEFMSTWNSAFPVEDLLSCELSIEYTVEPYDPGVMYDRDGSGYPPSGGGIDSVMIAVKSAVGEEHTYTQAAELAEIQAAIDKYYDVDVKFRRLIDDYCIEDAGERWSEREKEYDDDN